MSSDPNSGADRARVLLIGLGPTTASALESLAERFEVAGLMRPDDPGDVAVRLAASLGVPVHGDTSIAALRALVDSLDPQAVAVSSYDRILPADLVGSRPFVNVHYAPLPRYRGRATVNWAIINGEQSAAISIHDLVPGLDAGGILFQDTTPIGPRTTVTELYEALNALQRKALGAAVARRLAGDPGEAQTGTPTYACTRIPDDGEIDWSEPTDAIDRLIRSLTPPYPGAFTWLGMRRLHVHRAEPVTDAPEYVGRIPGRVALVSKSNGFVDVLTGDGVLRLYQAQWEGEAVVPAPECIRSVKSTLGLRGSDLLARIDRLESEIKELRERR